MLLLNKFIPFDFPLMDAYVSNAYGDFNNGLGFRMNNNIYVGETAELLSENNNIMALYIYRNNRKILIEFDGTLYYRLKFINNNNIYFTLNVDTFIAEFYQPEEDSSLSMYHSRFSVYLTDNLKFNRYIKKLIYMYRLEYELNKTIQAK